MPRRRKFEPNEYWIEQATNAVWMVWKRLYVKHQEAWVFAVALNRVTGDTVEKPFRLKYARVILSMFLQKYQRDRWVLFFNPNGYNVPRRSVRVGLSTPFAWSILRDADWRKQKPFPNLVLGTHGYREAIWFCGRFQTPATAEAVSKAIAAREIKADRQGARFSVLVHIPHTYDKNRQLIEVTSYVSASGRPPVVRSRKAIRTRELSVKPTEKGVYTATEPYQDFLHPTDLRVMRDRRIRLRNSERAVRRIVDKLVGVKADINDVACVVWRGPYFRALYGEDRQRLNQEIADGLARARMKRIPWRR